jgi:tRNA(Ile)-lysidine synthase
MTTFEKKVLKTIREKKLLTGAETVVIALSGGADSVALLRTLTIIQAELDLCLRAAHFNHLLRGKESDEDEQFVRSLCDSLSVPLDVGRLQNSLLSEGSNLENQLRTHRYDFLAECALKNNAVVATGHNLNDQAETFLLKLFRGAGVTGLSGIRIKRSHALGASGVKVIRPLLECSKDEILAFLKANGQDHREDKTNTSIEIDRNFIRHRLIPDIEERFNPQLIQVLHRTAGLLEEIQKYLEVETKNWIDRNTNRDSEDWILDASLFKKVDVALRRGIIRSLIQRLNGSLEDVNLKHVEAVLSLAEGPSGRQVILPGDLRVIKEFEQLRFTCKSHEVAEFEYSVSIPGEVDVIETGKQVFIRKAGNKSEFPTFVSLEDRLVIRNRRPGDRYRTRAGGPARSVKKILMEQKIPFTLRSSLLMVESGGEIVWMEGFPQRRDTAEKDGILIEIEIREFTTNVCKTT